MPNKGARKGQLDKQALAQFRYARTEPTAPRVRELHRLHEKLNESAHIFAAGLPDERKQAVIWQLQDVVSYLEKQGFGPATTAPLIQVITALIDGKRGRMDPILAPAKREAGGAPKLGFQRQMADGTLAAMTKLWLEAHKGQDGNQDEKIAAAVRAMTGRWFNSISRSRLKSALEKVREGGESNVAKRQYDNLLDWLIPVGMPPMKAFRTLQDLCNEAGSEVSFGEN